MTRTDKTGTYRFRTIKPAAYPPEGGWRRTPHIHFAVDAPGAAALTTQMYFPDEPLNEQDGLFRRFARDPEARARVTATLGGDDAERPTAAFDIVLDAEPF